MNGSRLNEHRTKRVPAWHWLVGIGLLAAAVGYGTGIARGEELNRHTGYALKGSNLCMANDGINQNSAKLLYIWITLVKKYDDFIAGSGEALTPNQLSIIQTLAEAAVCGQLNDDFPGVALDITDGFILFEFDPQLGFGTDKWLMFKEGFILDK